MTKPPEDHFIDAMGLHYESAGASRLMGRILGWLLICDPPHQSSQQLMERLQTTSGTISTNTRILMMMGLLQKVHVTGERASYFQIAEDAWHRTLVEQMKHMTAVRLLAADSLHKLSATHDTARLRGMHELYSRFEEHFEQLLSDWEREHSPS